MLLQEGVWQSANADRIAALVDLSASEVRELLREGTESPLADLAERLRTCMKDISASLSSGPDIDSGAAGSFGEVAESADGLTGSSRAEGVHSHLDEQRVLQRMLDALEDEVVRAINALESSGVRWSGGPELSRGSASEKDGHSEALAKLSECLLDGAGALSSSE